MVEAVSQVAQGDVHFSQVLSVFRYILVRQVTHVVSVVWHVKQLELHFSHPLFLTYYPESQAVQFVELLHIVQGYKHY